MKKEYIEKIYAGWLAKIIGIRMGAQIESWSYEKIAETCGEITGYPYEYSRFAADDDSNGPLFFLRALEDGAKYGKLLPRHVADALLNYAPYEHGFFWWGGYGMSTEHTAYLNLWHGIPAPRSGSILQNGSTVAEQIGGQIFIDTWGLVSPGDPDRAAEYARAAASVTHDGEGVLGGVFVATAISIAFEETDIRHVIERALGYLPEDSEYRRVARAVMAFHDENPGDWRKCFFYVRDNFGYDRYPGNCHIIPNSAVMILSMLYGAGDLTRTIAIACMCGWDTDCNAGNVATIVGVLAGLPGIEERLRKPVNDFLACSGVVGSRNIMDIPSGALYIARLAHLSQGELFLDEWREELENPDVCGFEFPGSTHAFEAVSCRAENSAERARRGVRSLKLTGVGKLSAIRRTYLYPSDFDDSRYDPAFSPTVYSGETVKASVSACEGARARLIAKDGISGAQLHGEWELLSDEWRDLVWKIPAGNCLIDRVGVEIEGADEAWLDEFETCGRADWSLDFKRNCVEKWTWNHSEISGFTRLRGITYQDGDKLHVTGSEYAELYTGRHGWSDYEAEFLMTPVVGDCHRALFRVQGAIRSYAATLVPGKILLQKNENGYRTLAEAGFDWKCGEEYVISVRAEGNTLSVSANGEARICFSDETEPYLTGGIGFGTGEGSHASLASIRVR